MLAGLSAALAGRRKVVDATSTIAEMLGTGAHGGKATEVDPEAAARAALMALGAIAPRSAETNRCLFSIGDLRQAILCWDFEEATSGEASRCVSRQLQLLFADMTLSARGVVTAAALTRSFGWDADQSFQQNDVHECMAVIVDAVMRETVGTPACDLVARFNSGMTESYVMCGVCGGSSPRRDAFTSLMLPVRGCGDVHAALAAYFSEETLSGDNAYACGPCGVKQTAQKGVRLVPDALPSTLFLQLNRFEFDFNTMTRRKVSDRLRPVLELDMAQHVSAHDASAVLMYDLVAVMMHVGGAMAGHYFAYILTPGEADGSPAAWVHFNDSIVNRIPEDSLARALGQSVTADVARPAAPGEATSTGAGAQPHGDAAGSVRAPVAVGYAALAEATTRTATLSKDAPLTDAAVGAYMLVYRRRDTMPGYLRSLRDTSIPVELAATLDEANAKYRHARKEWEVERARLRVRVHFHAAALREALALPGDAAAEALAAVMAAEGQNLPPDAVDVVVNDSETVEALVAAAVRAAGSKLLKGSSGYVVDIPSSRTRLRYYNSIKNVALAPVEPENGPLHPDADVAAAAVAALTVKDAGLTSGRVLILETRTDASVPWPAWFAGAFTFRFVLLNPASRTYDAPIQVTLPPGEASVGAVRAHAQTTYAAAAKAHGMAGVGVPPRCRLVFLKSDSEENAVVLSNDSVHIQEAASPLRITPGDVIHVELCPQDGPGSDPLTSEGSFIVSTWDANINTVTIAFNSPTDAAAGEVSLSLRMDQRSPLGELRTLIAQQLGLPAQAFRIRRGKAQLELKDDAQSLTYYGLVGGGSVFIEEGRPLAPNEFECKLSLHIPVPPPTYSHSGAAGDAAPAGGASGNTGVLVSLGTLPLAGDMTTVQAKAAIHAHVCGRPIPAEAADLLTSWPDAACLRLRDRAGAGSTKLGAVFINDRTLAASVAGKLNDGREIVVQLTPAPETFRAGDILLTVALWRPLVGTLQLMPEAAYAADMPLTAFAGALCKQHALAHDDVVVRLVKQWQWQLADVSSLWKLRWTTVTAAIPVEEAASPSHGHDSRATVSNASPKALDAEADATPPAIATHTAAPAPAAARVHTVSGDPLRLKHGDCVVIVLAHEADDVAAVGRPADFVAGPGGASGAAGGGARRWAGAESGFKIYTPEEQRAREAARAAEEAVKQREIDERSVAIAAAIKALKADTSAPAADTSGVVPAAVDTGSTSESAATVVAPVDPVLDKYVKLLQMGVTADAVRNRMRLDGVDVSLMSGLPQ